MFITVCVSLSFINAQILFVSVSIASISTHCLSLSTRIGVKLFIYFYKGLVKAGGSCETQAYIVPFKVIFNVLSTFSLREVLSKVNLVI